MSTYVKPDVSSHETEGSHFGPLKWMSPESLMMQKSSKKSDVWSFAVTIWEIFVEDEPYGADPPYLAAASVIHQGIRPNLSKLPASIRKDITPLLQACWRKFPEERLSMKEVLMWLSGIKDKYVALLQDMSLVETAESESITRLPVPSMVYTQPPQNCNVEKKELSKYPHHATSIGEKIRLHLSRTAVEDDFSPNKRLEITQSQYLFHCSMGNNRGNLQYSTHSGSLLANSKPTPTYQSRSSFRDTLSRPLSQRYDKQYSAIIPSKNHLLRPSANEQDRVTPYCTPTSFPPAVLRSTYRNIDSDSTTDATTENDRENGSTVTVERDEKVDRNSNFQFKRTIGDKSLAVNFNEHHDDIEEASSSSASLVMLGKIGVTAAMYQPLTYPQPISYPTFTYSSGSDEEI